MGQIVAIIILVTTILSGALYSVMHPILLPDGIVTAISTLVYTIWQWDGIIPVEAIFNCFQFILWLMICKLIFKLFFGMVSMLTGGHQPDID